jgi:hypothetical protein
MKNVVILILRIVMAHGPLHQQILLNVIQKNKYINILYNV